MTGPSNSTIPAIEFSRFDARSYMNPLLDNGYQFRPIADQEQQYQQQHPQLQRQQPVVSRLEQELESQGASLPPPAPPLLIQQQLQPSPQNQETQQDNSMANVATASATVFSSLELAAERVMPGIFLTKNFTSWNEENLRSHGFTHIIIIDKHIQEFYYPSPIFKLSTQSESADAFDTYEYYCQPSSLNFGKEFEAIDLNFGEKSYLTTVLPNCYRAVKFINKALQSGGQILVIDCNGGEQKCVTIIVAYLMFKYNINFNNAFARLKGFYEKADLDRFYMSQLYEYEPILQVQRAQSRGHSCSRELHAAILKRKKTYDDVSDEEEGRGNSNGNGTSNAGYESEEFLDTLNPLSHFNTKDQKQQEQIHQQLNAQELHQHSTSSTFHDCDDFAME